MESILEINQNTRKRYMEGWKNEIFREYFYIQEGLNTVNQWKYVIGGIYAFAFLAKISNPWHLGLIFVALIPVLRVVGYIWARRAKKSIEVFSMENTTVFGKYGIEMSERQIEQNDEIINLLKKLNDR